MPNSYRIRTQVGVDKRIDFKLEQDFEFLEVLSLKITQSELYDRVCSDYGVIVGRVNVNVGFGVPNAKISVFIPLNDDDSLNPIISTIYPYRSLNDVNEDGYRYNLLPYNPSYDWHVPTGTFPDRDDVLINKPIIEVYDKYYKFTVKTNESGDFMIFGVPVGSATLFMDVDLSDIGEFSLSPQDMIRMGLATESQVDGLKFRSSNNLYSLPQIVSLRAEVEVAPLWGDPELCQMSITRNDFDLAEAGIMIEPTAVFMGSIISTIDKMALKRYDFNKQYCKVRLKTGELCRLITGPGEIVSIRQTIQQDSLGRPILEQYVLENNGKVIDENGTWLVDIPMNMDYVVTDEFGNRVISTDPKVGIPTTAKYRFKVKWEQPTNQNNPIQRAYFLLPNIKEWWTTTSDPNQHVQASSNSIPQPVNPNDYVDLQSSYAFSLDWTDYGMINNPTTASRQIQEAINADDRFYKFTYNKVYTIAQLIDQYRGGSLPRRINSIKNVLDETCEDSNPFPVNDAMFQLDFLYLLFTIFLRIMTPILLVIMMLQHILAFLLWLLSPIIFVLVLVTGYITYSICKFLNTWPVRKIIGGDKRDCGSPSDPVNNAKELAGLYKRFTNVPLPNLTYPDCEMCNCQVGSSEYEQVYPNTEEENQLLSQTNFSTLSDWNSNLFYDRMSDFFESAVSKVPDYFILDNMAAAVPFVMAGLPVGIGTSLGWSGSTATDASFFGATTVVPGEPDVRFTYNPSWLSFPTGYRCSPIQRTFSRNRLYLSPSLTTAERLNLFNTKAKYFNSTALGGAPNDGGTAIFSTGGQFEGVNQIKVKFGSDNSANSQFHLDNVMILSCDAGTQQDFPQGRIVYFQDNKLTGDINAISGSTDNPTGAPSISGNTIIGTNIYTGSTKQIFTANVPYADPDNSMNTLSVNYTLTADPVDNEYHIWPTDIEYYQVITAMTISQFGKFVNPSSHPNTFFKRCLDNSMSIYKFSKSNWSSDNLVTSQGGGILGWEFGGQIYRPLVYNDYQSPGNTQLCFNPTPTIIPPPGVRTSFVQLQNSLSASSESLQQVIVILIRGVDPYSTRNINTYDLSKLFGYPFGSGPSITGKYKLNIPIQSGLRNADHSQIANNTLNDTHANKGIFYDTYHYLPGVNWSGFTTNLHTYYSRLDAQPTNISASVGFIFDMKNYSYSSPSYGDLRVKGYDRASCSDTGGGVVSFPCGFWNGSYNMVTTDFTNQIVLESETLQNNIQNTAYAVCNNPLYSIERDGNWSPVDNYTAFNNKGYYRNESVEGGSILAMTSFHKSSSSPSVTGLGKICRFCNCSIGSYQPDLYAIQDPRSVYWTPSYSTATTLNFSTTNSAKRKIVMRSDRLPSSTLVKQDMLNSYMLHQNPIFAIYTADDDGALTSVPNVNFGSQVPIPSDDITGTTSYFNNVITTLNECSRMLPLKCYYNDSSAPFFNVSPSNNRDLRWNGTCTTLDVAGKERPIFDVGVGCYLFVTRPILSIKVDILMLLEWKSRLDLTFGACRNVFGHMFTNNWINGVLYAYSFKNDVFYTSPFDPASSANQPYANYCYDTIYFHPVTQNFYYRSAPYKGNVFIGKQDFLRGGNDEIINNPTTIVDLGPRTPYLTYLSPTNEFNGYNMNNLTESTFKDVSDILNVYILSRLANANFWDGFFGAGGAGILGLFSRVKRKGLGITQDQKNMVDGDYAQMISINSELGVKGFDAENYGLESVAYVQVGANASEGVFGIFFDSDQQPRDFVSPKREIFNDTTSFPYPSSFDYLPVNDQEVPFYGWNVIPSTSAVIFGSQQNEWRTNNISSFKYQSQDRLNTLQLDQNNPGVNFNFMSTIIPAPSSFYRGYIYNIQVNTSSPGYKEQPSPTFLNYNVGLYPYQVGAPFHFYFGLKKGATAFDRFRIKWIEGEQV